MSQGFAFVRTGQRYAVLNQTLGVIARNAGYASSQAMTEAMLTRVATLCTEGMSEIAAHDKVVGEIVTKFNANFKARLAQGETHDA